MREERTQAHHLQTVLVVAAVTVIVAATVLPLLLMPESNLV